MRYGGSAGDAVSYRASAEYFDNGPFSNAAGQAAHDRWSSGQGDARVDWRISPRDSVTVEGDAYRGNAQETVYPNYPAIGLSPPFPDSVAMSGGYALGRWTHQFSDRSDLAMQVSTGDENRLEGFGQLDMRSTQFDFQHHFAVSSRNDLMWGAGFDIDQDDTTSGQIFPAPSASVRFVPASGAHTLASFFAQDQIAVVPERLSLTLGTKIEYANYFGFDVQPSARLLWTMTPRQGLWASVSRAVRTPDLVDLDTLIQFQPTQSSSIVGMLSGNLDIRPEQALAYEAGYRNQPARWVTLDLAAFFTVYHDLRTIDIGTPYMDSGPPSALLVPLQFGSNAAGHTYGIEMATNWSVTQRWRLTGNYSWFRYGLSTAQLSAQSVPLDIEGSSPAHQVQFRSQVDLGRGFAFDTAVYFVSALRGLDVPGYVRSDARIGWRVTRATEISLSGQDLLDGRHLEFATTDYVQCSQIGRTVQLKATWAF